MFSFYSEWIDNYSEKTATSIQANSFPLPNIAEKAFKDLKTEVKNAMVYFIDKTIPFTVETNVSNHTIAAILNQPGRPISFFSRTLSISEQNYSLVEKEAQAIIKTLYKLRQNLTEHNFSLFTD